MTTTRTIRSFGPQTIYIEGLTKGPTAGWSWDGTTLTHPLGIYIQLTPAAAERITKTIDACAPQVIERIGAVELHKLPEAERAGFEYDPNSGDDSNISGCIRRTGGEPTTCDFDTTEVTATGRR